MWENEEYQDFDAFEESLKSLSESSVLTAIENAAHELFHMKIGICFTKLGARELEFYFVVRSETDRRNVLGLSLSPLMTKIAEILDYDGIFIKKREVCSEKEIRAQYSEVIEICSANFKKIAALANDYRNYLKRKIDGSDEKCFQERLVSVEPRSDAHNLSQLSLMPAASKEPNQKRLKSGSVSEETLAADPKLEGELTGPLKDYVSKHPERSAYILSDFSSFCSSFKLIK